MIPVQNIYYMLSYAFQALQTQTYKNLATENFHNTAELCAAILDKGVSTQLKRGLERDSDFGTEYSKYYSQTYTFSHTNFSFVQKYT